ncbi:putative RNA binding protein YcfA (HicA-like mRNA interferase family) [Novosphingobium sp. PhB165]|nr:putative RNA binding protein YcfA (HicA-like mRNA interferase family) [Novosphingobium sp. PhB165]
MIKPAKLYAELLEAQDRTISFRDFEKLLRAFGFTHKRTKGSHQIWIHPALNRPFPVQPSAKDAKAYQVREFLELVEQHALYMIE